MYTLLEIAKGGSPLSSMMGSKLHQSSFGVAKM